RMRILVLEFSARQQIPSFDQGLDDRLVGVALIAFSVDHAAAFEAGRFFRKESIGVDGVGDARVDASCFERALVGHPNIEVVAAMAWRGMNEAGARVLSDVLTTQERNTDVIFRIPSLQRMGARQSL